MPTLANCKKYEDEKPAQNVLRLIPNDRFYRAYNKSAWIFTILFADYTVVRKYIKSIKEDLYYIGCPRDKLLEYLTGYPYVKTEWGFDVTIPEDKIPTDENQYEEWKKQVKERPNGRNDEAYRDARVHKRNRPYQIHFEMHLEKNLIALRDEIYEQRYKPLPSTCFIIHEPKMREVFAADFRDRVVHHLFYNYTHKAFERTFIADTYSCIPGRGTHYGINRLEHHIRSCSQNYTEPCYVLKLDISGYFMHIHRGRLLQIAADTLRKQKVYNPLTAYLLREIVLLNPVERCVIIGDPSEWDSLPPSKSLFCSPAGCGLPIGNLTSQLFSNVYLNKLDQYCKRSLHCRHYGRYVDDMYIVSQDKNELNSKIQVIEDFLQSRLHLSLARNKIRIYDAGHGVPFLGQFLKPYRRYIENQSLRRMKNKIHFAGDRITDAQRASFLGVLSHVSAHNLHVINLQEIK